MWKQTLRVAYITVDSCENNDPRQEAVGTVGKEMDNMWMGSRVRNFIAKLLGWLLCKTQGLWEKECVFMLFYISSGAESH